MYWKKAYCDAAVLMSKLMTYQGIVAAMADDAVLHVDWSAIADSSVNLVWNLNFQIKQFGLKRMIRHPIDLKRFAEAINRFEDAFAAHESMN